MKRYAAYVCVLVALILFLGKLLLWSNSGAIFLPIGHPY